MNDIYTESQLQQQVIDYLELRGFYTIRLNAGNRYVDGKNGKKYCIRGVASGTPDLLCFRKNSPIIFIELKVHKNKLSEAQEERMKILREYGAVCYTIRSIEELQENIV